MYKVYVDKTNGVGRVHLETCDIYTGRQQPAGPIRWRI